MKSLFYILLFTLFLLGCNQTADENSNNKMASPIVDTTTFHSAETGANRETGDSQLKAETPGTLLKRISFEVATNNKKDFEDGIIPWASIEKPNLDIPHLVDKDKIVISENKVSIIIDYPLTNEYKFELESKNGFTRQQLLLEISRRYNKIYEEEEKTASEKTIPMDKRTKLSNRNETNGKYGIWGHDIADLLLTQILVYKTDKGELILTLEIDS